MLGEQIWNVTLKVSPMHRSSAPAACWLITVFIVAAVATEPAPRAWRTAATIDAPEAHQAAAADERYFYAIGSTSIARYDRASGMKSGSSTGAAQHLNSGFVHEGKLYCAHSNYPRTPELSQIKVLDLESLELADLHDFGDYGGSLTWVVRHEDGWWCNFARYGSANAETFVVRFDDEWNEQARWTYPAEVIEELGNYSLSGGIWRDGELLVTGHDDRVLFRLRRPESGSVLELIGTVAVPFTGQGIASDSVTGGLVGIDRRRKQVILAEPAP
jgi:hypothetical protein